jgi:hypothetical protein
LSHAQLRGMFVPQWANVPNVGYVMSELHEQLCDMGVEDALTMDGYDDCAVGVLERYGMEPIVIYDKEKVIEKLVADGCDSYEGALEFYEFNQLGGWHGDRTPGFLIKLQDDA